MLESLDTLIAFTLIFTDVSMLVTMVVQIISNLLNLRGPILLGGLAETFETIDPSLAPQAKPLADHLLKDSMLSDHYDQTPPGRSRASRSFRKRQFHHSQPAT